MAALRREGGSVTAPGLAGGGFACQACVDARRSWSESIGYRRLPEDYRSQGTGLSCWPNKTKKSEPQRNTEERFTTKDTKVAQRARRKAGPRTYTDLRP